MELLLNVDDVLYYATLALVNMRDEPDTSKVALRAAGRHISLMEKYA